VVFGCWVGSAGELVLWKPQPDRGFGIRLEVWRLVRARWQNGGS